MGLDYSMVFLKMQFDDSKRIAKDMSKTGHWGNGDYEIQIADDEELEYIFSLIKQVYKINNNRLENKF